MGLLDFFNIDLGIDPGSENLRIIKDGKTIFDELSKISIENYNTISGFGDSIKTTGNNIILSPVNYSISDFHGFEQLLRAANKKGLNDKSYFQYIYTFYFSIPTSTSEVEKRAYRDSAEHAGAKSVYLIDQSYCAAIGLNILSEKKNFILIDFSSSKAEISVFANGILISINTVRYGTLKIVQLLKNFLFRSYRLSLTTNEIYDILDKMGGNDDIIVQHLSIKTSEVNTILSCYFNLVNDEFLEAIERVSNHSDIDKIISNGIYFTGGGIFHKSLIMRLNFDSKIKFSVSQTPQFDVINGLKKVMADKKLYKDLLLT